MVVDMYEVKENGNVWISIENCKSDGTILGEFTKEELQSIAKRFSRNNLNNLKVKSDEDLEREINELVV